MTEQNKKMHPSSDGSTLVVDDYYWEKITDKSPWGTKCLLINIHAGTWYGGILAKSDRWATHYAAAPKFRPEDKVEADKRQPDGDAGTFAIKQLEQMLPEQKESIQNSLVSALKNEADKLRNWTTGAFSKGILVPSPSKDQVKDVIPKNVDALYHDGSENPNNICVEIPIDAIQTPKRYLICFCSYSVCISEALVAMARVGFVVRDTPWTGGQPQHVVSGFFIIQLPDGINDYTITRKIKRALMENSVQFNDTIRNELETGHQDYPKVVLQLKGTVTESL